MILLVLIFGITLISALAIADIREIYLPRYVDLTAKISIGILFIFALSPFSIWGSFFDKLLVFIAVVYLLLKLIMNEKVSYRRVRKQVWGLCILQVILGGVLFVSIFTGDFLLCKIQPQEVTKLEEYRLVHRKINSDFMYSGDHEIVIHKKLKFFPLLEVRQGKVVCGSFHKYEPSPFEYKINPMGREVIIMDNMYPHDHANYITKFKY